MANSLRQKTIHGVIWSAIDRFASQGIAFIISIVLARLLTPDDYGIIAMLAIFISISQAFVDSGFSSAIVQKQNRTELDLSTALYTNIGIGIVFYLILFFCSPFIASFYNEPILESVTKVMGLVFLIFSLSNVQQAVLTIRVDFKTQTKISLISVTLSGLLGITLAYCEYGVWALAWQQVVAASIRCILLWKFLRWRPLLKFSKKSFKELFSFGSKMLATGLLNSVFNNLYTIIIGKKFNAASLGYYSRADQLAQFPSTNVTGILQRVTFPVLAQLQNEHERFNEAYFKILKLTMFVIFPLMFLLSALSEPIIKILLTEKWIGSANLLGLISFALMLYPIYSLNLNVLEAKGRSDYLLKSEFINKIINVITLLLSLPLGLIAICYGRILSSICAVCISAYFSQKATKISMTRAFTQILPTFLLSIGIWGIAWLLQFFVSNSWLQIIIATILGGSFYIGIAHIFKFKELTEIKKILQKK